MYLPLCLHAPQACMYVILHSYLKLKQFLMFLFSLLHAPLCVYIQCIVLVSLAEAAPHVSSLSLPPCPSSMYVCHIALTSQAEAIPRVPLLSPPCLPCAASGTSGSAQGKPCHPDRHHSPYQHHLHRRVEKQQSLNAGTVLPTLQH